MSRDQTAAPTEHRLPPFRSLLKSTEVEDPINIMVHRPLAYGFVWSIFRTPLTPNMVTVMAMIVGLASGWFFLQGGPTDMIVAGALLWAAAILDGADGILARAKNMGSQFGRALDGTADIVVACATVFPAFYHLWTKEQDPTHLYLMVPVILLTVPHLHIYDYYKESYLRATRLDRGGEGDDPEKVAKLAEQARERGPVAYFTTKYVLLPFVESQHKIIGLLNPLSLREGVEIERSEETAAVYRRHNLWPMRLWTIISLAPHSYLMAICAMFDRLDVYLWIRLVGMNSVMLVATVWQRRATEKTMDELTAMGAVRGSVPSREGVVATN